MKFDNLLSFFTFTISFVLPLKQILPRWLVIVLYSNFWCHGIYYPHHLHTLNIFIQLFIQLSNNFHPLKIELKILRKFYMLATSMRILFVGNIKAVIYITNFFFFYPCTYQVTKVAKLKMSSIIMILETYICYTV